MMIPSRHLLLVLLAVLLLAPGTTTAMVWRVEQDGSGDFTTIQPAVDVAAAGDTILIGPGEYTGTLYPVSGQLVVAMVATDDLTFLGREGGDLPRILADTDDEQVFTIAIDLAPEVTGLTVVGLYVESRHAGIRAMSGDLRRLTLDRCQFRCGQKCASVRGGHALDFLAVTDCEFRGRLPRHDNAGLECPTVAGYVRNCLFEDISDGIDGGVLEVTDCRFHNCGYALYCKGSFRNCEIRDCSFGVSLYHVGTVELNDCFIDTCRWLGISLEGDVTLTGSGNVLRGGTNWATMRVDRANTSGFKGNVIGHVEGSLAVDARAVWESGVVDLSGNDWTVYTDAEIDELIRDAHDDPEATWTVQYRPYLHPQHFVPVPWQGGPNRPMMIQVHSVITGDRRLGPYDEIAVFDDTLCLACVKLDTISMNQSWHVFSVNMEDLFQPGHEGFQPGDPITIRIWDESEQHAYVPLATFSLGQGQPAEGIFTPLETIYATLSVIPYQIPLSLQAGWNLFSLADDPLTNDPLVLLEPVLPVLDVIYDQHGNVLYRDPGSGQWVNGIGTLRLDQGYIVHVREDVEALLPGYLNYEAVRDTFQTGWNIAGFPRIQEEVTTESLIGGLIAQGAFVKAVDDQGRAFYRHGYTFQWVDEIGVLEPGEGYWIKVSQPAVYVFPPTGVVPGKRRIPVVEPGGGHGGIAAAGPWQRAWQGNPWQPHRFELVSSVADLGLAWGDVLAAFDGDVCVGLTTVRDPTARLGVVTALDDPDTPIQDGFRAGHPLALMLYRAAEDRIERLSWAVVPGPTGGNDVFTPLQVTFLDVTGAVPVGSGEVPASLRLGQPYPNPFNPVVSLPVSVPDGKWASLRIYDLAGRCVATLFRGEPPQGERTIRWYGRDDRGRLLPSGRYSAVLETEGNRISRSLLLVR